MTFHSTLKLSAVIGCALVLGACGEDEAPEAAVSVAECPTSFWHLREETGTFKCSVEPGCSQAGGLFGSNPYLANGGICSAAIQTGLLKDAPIVLDIVISEYKDETIEGSEANGVTSATPSGGSPDPGTQIMTISVAE